jgi:alkylresorcinol/alkylpyrone synthase
LKQVLLGDNGNETRYLALRELTDGLDMNPNTLNARFAQHAPALATQAAERALTGCRLRGP